MTSRAARILNDPAVKGLMLKFALALAAQLDAGHPDLNWLAARLWPVGGADVVRGLIENDLADKRVLPKFFPEVAWFRCWNAYQEQSCRPALRLVRGGVA